MLAVIVCNLDFVIQVSVAVMWNYMIINLAYVLTMCG